MKRILILVIPLALFAGFLFIKPPAIGADAKPITVITPDVITTPKPSDSGQPLSPTATKNPNSGKKPSISGGGDDDDDDEEDDDDDDDDRVKPKYGGHDDDDYDD
jgi:hypothetical protein